ncbi:MAG TPA: glycosyl hydrolase family 28-related protein [Chitinophagaceae bacterium]|nr:glycosyl hydrolase family 28-related protein [Chitinophagaceae bacterium]
MNYHLEVRTSRHSVFFVISKISLIIFLVILSGFFCSSFSQGHPATDDEFVGPFANWINVKTQFGAIGDGSTDETVALQAALNSIGNSNSSSSVVYLPAGTYLITGTLSIKYKTNVSIIGSDPATTKIIWGGAASGTMLNVNGVAYSRINRITFDGAGSAAIVIDQSWDGVQGYFDTGNEYADDEFKNIGIGIRGGHLGYGFAETAIMRCKFTNNTTAGITLGNFNALDVWVWHSVFQSCAVGITNNNTTSSAGNFKVYNSIFRNSTISDIIIGNTGEFAFRDNVSTNSQMFLKATLKSYPANITLQSNTIIDPVASKAIDIQDQGPIVLFDNIIRSRGGAVAPVISHTPFPTGEFFSMGNTFTVANPIQATGRKIIYDKAVVTAASLNTLAEPVLPGTQPNFNRTIFEVPAGSDAPAVQAIINQAALLTGTRPVVHFAYSTYNIQSTLYIPSGTDMQLVGNGHVDVNPTWLIWTGSTSGPIINITGPSKVTFRDLAINGNNVAANIIMSDVDQVGSRVFMHELEANLNTNGLLVNGLDNTLVLAYNSRFSQTTGKAIKVIGGSLAANGSPQQAKTIMYGGLEWDNNISHEVSNAGNLLIRDVWYESSNNGAYLNLTGKGSFVVEGSCDASPRGTAIPQVTISGLSGKASFINSYFQDRIAITGSGVNTKVLGLGVLFGDNTLPVGPSTTTYFENTTTPAGDIRSFNSRSHNNPNLATPRSGSFALNDIGTIDSTFIAGMIEPARDLHAQVLTSLGNGVTDVRFYRVWLYKGLTGLAIEGNLTVLPIKFISVNSECNNGNTRITWKTSNETGLKKFDIERNYNDTNWNAIASINAVNTGMEKTYSYNDKTNNNNSIYRIVAYEANGTKTVSNLFQPSCSFANENFMIYPNPVNASTFVSVTLEKAAAMELSLYDNSGILIKRTQANLLRGKNRIPVDLAGLSKGSYTLKATWGTNVKVNKLIKVE